MIHLKKSLAAWNTNQFSPTFKQETLELDIKNLPLQQALQFGSYATKEGLQIMINSTTETHNHITINTSIFYSSFIAGCNCSDDPSTVDLNAEYCEIQFNIDKATAATTFNSID